MTKRMLIDTTHAEETRVVVLDGNRLDDYDVETSAKKQLKGNIYLAKIVRIEPSLQAAFVEYGGNRHGFLAFSEIHPDYYQIPVADRERLIALQEEEARAEEARADREDEAAESGVPIPVDEAAPDHRAAPLEIPDDSFHDQPVAQPDAPGFDEQAFAEGEPGDAAGFDEAAGDGHDQGVEAAAESDSQVAELVSAEPAPEIVGGESADDGQAQRRTARFLRQYKIQEVMRRRQILLIQVVKEERGNKGAALTTYISLAGRFSVLMPNSLRGGGVSRKITSAADRRRLKEITTELEIPRGMAMIVRTAGAQRPRPEIRRDCEYLLRTWDDIRETTLASIAPCLVYEEASLIKRAIRDVYTRDVEEIVVDGEAGWKGAREFMRMLMPSNASKVNLWRDGAQKLFSHYQVEHHLDAMLQPTVQLRSGGYLVINQTEALVAIDVNSGRSTKERGIEETALRTNIEAADEVARQLRLRDLAGLIVIDFIDMESRRNNTMVEKRLKDALRNDRARIQVGSISHFGLMEMSRQRLRPSIAESSFVTCPHCAGSGFMRGIESSALHVLRAIEEEAGRRKAGEILVHVASPVALYVLNNKRSWLMEIESRHQMTVQLAGDDSLIPPALRIEKIRAWVASEPAQQAAVTRIPIESAPAPEAADAVWDDEPAEGEDVVIAPVRAAAERPETGQPAPGESTAESEDAEHRRKRRRRRRRGGRREDGSPMPEGSAQPELGDAQGDDEADAQPGETGETMPPSLQPGESLDSPSVFQADASDTALPIEATAPPADGAGKGRRRRGGGRNRARADAGAEAVDEAPMQRAPRPYNGPTPADPFAGSFDIFEMIEREADESLALVPSQAASAASQAMPKPKPPEPMSEPEAPLEVVTSTSPVPELALDNAPSPAEPEIAAETPALSAEAPVTAAVPVADAPPADVPAADLPAADVPEVAPEPTSEAAPEPGTKPARVAKPRKPRPSRAKKPVVAAEPDEPAPLLENTAAEPEAVAAPMKPEAVAAPMPVETDPAPASVDPAPPAAPVAASPEPAPVPAPPESATHDPSIVQAVVIGDTPAPARRTGWWKR